MKLATLNSVAAGGHLNPAVTLSFMAIKKISVKRGIMYMVAQFSGGLLGAGLIRWWVPKAQTVPLSSLLYESELLAEE